MPSFAALTVDPDGAIKLEGMHPNEPELTFDEAFVIANKAARKGAAATVLTLWERGEGEGDSLQLCAYDVAEALGEHRTETELGAERSINDGRKMHFTVYRYADVSTSCMTARDGEILNEVRARPFCLPVIAKYPEGYFIRVSAERWCLDEDIVLFRNLGMSQAFVDLLIEAHEQGIMLIRFDQDAAEVAGAPQHDW